MARNLSKVFGLTLSGSSSKAFWLLGSGLLGLARWKRKFRKS
jgi:hypothetical protein